VIDIDSVECSHMIGYGAAIVHLMRIRISLSWNGSRLTPVEQGVGAPIRSAPGGHQCEVVATRTRWASGRIVDGLVVMGWKQALNTLAIAYPGRLPEPL
jgi:hypothetical protein